MNDTGRGVDGRTGARQADAQRNAQHLLVEVGGLVEAVVLAAHVAVVGGEQHRRVPLVAVVGEQVQHAADRLVHQGHVPPGVGDRAPPLRFVERRGVHARPPRHALEPRLAGKVVVQARRQGHVLRPERWA